MFYDLTVNTWGREEIDAIQRVIASDRFTIGPCVAAFEDAFAASVAAAVAMFAPFAAHEGGERILLRRGEDVGR